MAKKSKPVLENDGPPASKMSAKVVVLVSIVSSLLGVAGGFGVAAFATSDKKEEQAHTAVETKENPVAPAEGGEHAQAPKSADGESHSEPSTPDHGSGNENTEESKTEHGSADPNAEHASADEAEGTGHAGPKSIPMDAVITNISNPSDVWVRLEAVLKASEPLPKETTDQIHEDFMAFFHTMRLEDLEGGSSYNDLKAELVARANTRAGGSIEAIYFKTFLFE